MGLFDKLIKGGVNVIKDITSDENKEKASDLLNSLKKSIEKNAGEIKKTVGEVKGNNQDLLKQTAGHTSSASDSAASYIPPDYEQRPGDKNCREKLLEVLEKEYPGYTVKENVSPTEIGGTGRFMNYSIAVYSGAVPKLFIMIIGKTTTAHREYRWSREEAENRGYVFLNFVEHFPNTPEYISDRLRRYL